MVKDSFDSLLKLNSGSLDVKEGSILEGIIIGKSKSFLIVNLGLKSFASYPIRHFKSMDIKVGEKLLFYVEQISSIDGELILNHEKAYKEIEFKNIWDLLIKNKQFVNGVILNHVAGGYSVGIGGLVAFLPNNQIPPVKYPQYLIGSKKTFSIINTNESKKNLVLSRTSALESRPVLYV